LQVPAERQFWVAYSDRLDSPATSKFVIRNVRSTSILLKNSDFRINHDLEDRWQP
jgi:hypothetical protein